MKKNMGKTDKLIRLIIAIILASLNLFVFKNSTVGIICMVFAVIMLVTSFLNFCPLYTVFGIDTCKYDSKQ